MDVDNAPPFGGLIKNRGVGRHTVDRLILVISRRTPFAGDPGIHDLRGFSRLRGHCGDDGDPGVLGRRDKRCQHLK